MKKIINLLFILLISWGLSGCIELYELIQLKADGTALWTFRVSIPDFPDNKNKEKSGEDDVDEGMADIFSSINKKGLQLVGREEEVKNGLKIFSIKVAANQLQDINQIYKDMGEQKNKSGKKKKGKDELDQLFGGSPIKVKKNKDGSLKISRSFKPPKIKKKKAKGKDKKKAEMGKEIEEIMLNSFRLRFEFMSPTSVISSNAERQYGQDLRWEVTLGYLLKSPFQMEVQIAPLPEGL